MVYKVEAYYRWHGHYVSSMAHATSGMLYESYEKAMEVAKAYFPESQVTSKNILKNKVYYTLDEKDLYCVSVEIVHLSPSWKLLWKIFKKCLFKSS